MVAERRGERRGRPKEPARTFNVRGTTPPRRRLPAGSGRRCRPPVRRCRLRGVRADSAGPDLDPGEVGARLVAHAGGPSRAGLRIGKPRPASTSFLRSRCPSTPASTFWPTSASWSLSAGGTANDPPRVFSPTSSSTGSTAASSRDGDGAAASRPDRAAVIRLRAAGRPPDRGRGPVSGRRGTAITASALAGARPPRPRRRLPYRRPLHRLPPGGLRRRRRHGPSRSRHRHRGRVLALPHAHGRRRGAAGGTPGPGLRQPCRSETRRARTPTSPPTECPAPSATRSGPTAWAADGNGPGKAPGLFRSV